MNQVLLGFFLGFLAVSTSPLWAYCPAIIFYPTCFRGKATEKHMKTNVFDPLSGKFVDPLNEELPTAGALSGGLE